MKKNIRIFLIIFIILFFALIYFIGLKKGITGNVIYSVEEEGSGSGGSSYGGSSGSSGGGSSGGGGGGSQGIIAALGSLGDIFYGKDNSLESCSDGILNQNEEGIDCGGVCESCGEILGKETGPPVKLFLDKPISFLIIFAAIIIVLLIVLLIIRKKNNLNPVIN